MNDVKDKLQASADSLAQAREGLGDFPEVKAKVEEAIAAVSAAQSALEPIVEADGEPGAVPTS